MIPENYYKYKETPIWENNTIPLKLLENHNTKDGIYAKLNIILGELEYTVFNEDNSVKSVSVLTVSLPGIINPQEWHKIKPLGNVKIFIEFYKEKEKKLAKKELIFKNKFHKSPHKEIQELTELMNNTHKTALDIGCGLGRNSIFLADNGFQVTSIDRNIEALVNITDVAKDNNLDINTYKVDLNYYIIDKKYDCIFSTVVLQFLEKKSAINIIHSMQSSTNIGGYNLIIVPIDSVEHICPIRFPALFKQGEIKNFYNNWEIIEYNEMLGTFHRKDELGNKIISRFATIIAKKI